MDSQYKIKASFTGVQNVVGGMKQIEDQIRKNTQALREQQNIKVGTQQQLAQVRNNALRERQEILENARQRRKAQQQHQTALGRTLEINERMYRFGREARYMWREQSESLRVYTEQAMRLARSQAQFRAIGLSPEDNERAFSGARDAAKKYNLDLAQTVDLVTDLHTATGHLESALQALPSAAKFKFAFSTLFGERFSPQMLESQIQQAFKYLEMTGAVNKGQAEMERRFNVIAQMMAATGGRVRPSDLLQMAQRGGPAVQSLSIEGLRNMAAPLQELKAAGAGTSLMSVYQALGGQLQKSAAEEFMKLGLLKPKGAIKFTTAGIRSQIARGAFGGFGDKMLEDPLAGADILMAAMKSHGIDTTKDNEIRKELRILFQNRTAQRLMSILTTQRGQIVKEAKLSEGAKDIEALFAEAGETPMGKMEKFQNALANLRMEIGGPLLTAMTSLAGAAMPFLKVAAAHPQLALTAIMTFKLAQGVSSIAAIGQASGIARLALQTQSVAVQTERAAVSTSLWRRQLGGIPGTLGTIVTLTLATAVIGYLMKLKDEAEQAWEEAKGIKAQGQRSYVKLLGTKEVPTETAEKIGREDVRTGVAEMLRQLRMPEWWRPMLLGRYGTVRPLASVPQSEIAEKLSSQMPGLKLGSQFGEFIKRIRYESGLGSADVLKFESAARSMFPESARRFDKALQEAGGDMSAAIKKLVEEDREAAQRVFENSTKLSESLQSGADAVEDFGKRVRSTRLPGEPEPEGGIPEAAHAKGGITRRRHVALVGENPELILPLSQFESVLGRLGGGRGSGAGGPVFHIDARGAQMGVGAEIKRAVLEAIRETGLHNLTDDGFRDRALAI
jgi:hypothetical protein